MLSIPIDSITREFYWVNNALDVHGEVEQLPFDYSSLHARADFHGILDLIGSFWSLQEDRQKHMSFTNCSPVL